MSDPVKKSLPERLQAWLTLTSSFALSVGAVWATVAALWRSATGELPVSKRFLLLSGAGIVSLFALGVWQLLRQRRQLRLIQDSAASPFRVSDDYEFDTDCGYWLERKSGLRVCADCLLPPTKIVSPLFEAIGSGFEGEEYVMVWRCGRCKGDYRCKTRHDT